MILTLPISALILIAVAAGSIGYLIGCRRASYYLEKVSAAYREAGAEVAAGVEKLEAAQAKVSANGRKR